MNTTSGHILIVDDETNIRTGLRDVLVKDGHTVTDAGSGEEALAQLASMDCDVAIVDIRMPGMSGVELLQAIRARWQYKAVIMLTGQGDLESAIAAVKAGAHDYLLKPAQPETIRQTVIEAVAITRHRKERARLLESLRSGLGRLDNLGAEDASELSQPADVRSLRIGDLHVDLGAHEVRRNGTLVQLSPSEFKLLVTLAARAGEAVDYVTLVQLSLGYEAELWEAKELIKRHIFALRHKIEPDPASPGYILNVRGVGYRLASPA